MAADHPSAPASAGPSSSLSTGSGLLLLLALSAFAVAPLLYPGTIQTHNGFVPLWNVADLRANLGDLGWTPHILTTFDTFRSAGLLPYYLAALLPLPPATAIKTILGLSLLLGGAGMFLWLRSWLGNGGALVSALAYIYLPHLLAAVYVRGAWGEALFWGLLPWAILAATYLVTTPRQFLLLPAALFWLALGLSQLGLTLWALLLLLALLLTVHRRQMLLPALGATLGTGAAMGVTWAVALSTPEAAAALPADHLLYPFQLFSAAWGFGPSRPGWDDGLSLQVGPAALGLAIIAVALWQRSPSSHPQSVSRRDPRLMFFGAAALVLVLLPLQLFAPLWSLPPLVATLTYPWQLLGLAGLCLAVLAGAALWIEPQLEQPPLLAAVVLIIILSVYSYLLPQFNQPEPAWLTGPQAQAGHNQLVLLDHDFTVRTSGFTVGLSQGQTAIPLTAHGPLRPGDLLYVNVRWQPLHPFEQDYKLFVHLADSSDTVLTQFDGRPLVGDYPTSRWIPGEIIADSYPLLLPVDAPPGPYRVFVGLYDEATGQRLSVPGDSAGRIILAVE